MRLALQHDLRTLEPIIGWGLAAGCFGLLGAAAFFPFGTLPKLCAFLLLTDLPCLTCGMTRSWVALVHGDVFGAIAWNPLGTALCLTALAGGVYAAARQLGAPALRVSTSALERRFIRFGIVLAVALNWGFVFSAGRV
ncbi:MAG: DUF2752 domain-containing protein [Deltaproteobacteria bacterium]|nr:DUF2752 domain-containing protein [Deltaproteobacteria bacterium]